MMIKFVIFLSLFCMSEVWSVDIESIADRIMKKIGKNVKFKRNNS